MLTFSSAILTSDIEVVLDRFSESTIDMDGRDRETYGREDDRPPRPRSASSSTGRRGESSGFGRFDDDLALSDDPPSWQERFGPARRRDASPSDTPRAASPSGSRRDLFPDDATVDRRSRRDVSAPSRDVSSRVRTPRQAQDDIVDERISNSVADPYDRLRRVSERRSRPPVETYPDVEDLAYGEELVTVRPRTARRERQAAALSRPSKHNLPQPQFRAVGSILARSSRDVGTLAPLAGAALASALALAVVTLLRLGSTAEWLVMRLDAGGEPTRWATNEALWRVPLLVVFATVAGLVVAWRLRRHDAFAAQFTLVSVLLLHGFGWVAAGRLLF